MFLFLPVGVDHHEIKLSNSHASGDSSAGVLLQYVADSIPAPVKFQADDLPEFGLIASPT